MKDKRGHTMTAKAFPRKKRPYMFAMTPTANALHNLNVREGTERDGTVSAHPTAALMSL
jgi:hypothetical protein